MEGPPQAVNNEPPPDSIWITAYVDYWHIKPNAMPLEGIDWSAFTHMIHFACGVDESYEKISTSNIFLPPDKAWFTPADQVVDAAHRHGKPILVAIGGAGNKTFAVGIEREHRTALIRDMLQVMDRYRYDGWDIDLEPVRARDTANLRGFITELYDSLRHRQAWYDHTRKPILTAAIIPSWYGELFASMHDKLDQVNIMTYDMGGTWFGKTWHNNAIYSRDRDGRVLEKDAGGSELTTVQKRLFEQLSYGSPRKKTGIGVHFYGYIWTGGVSLTNYREGVSEPRQRWSAEPSEPKYIEHWKIQRDYLDTARSSVHYDALAKGAYVKRVVEDGDPANDQFVSFQDTTFMTDFIAYMKENSLGGFIIYDLGGGYLPAGYPERDQLLQALKKAVISRYPRQFMEPSTLPIMR